LASAFLIVFIQLDSNWLAIFPHPADLLAGCLHLRSKQDGALDEMRMIPVRVELRQRLGDQLVPSPGHAEAWGFYRHVIRAERERRTSLVKTCERPTTSFHEKAADASTRL
jgi:hypothetical protein